MWILWSTPSRKLDFSLLSLLRSSAKIWREYCFYLECISPQPHYAETGKVVTCLSPNMRTDGQINIILFLHWISQSSFFNRLSSAAFISSQNWQYRKWESTMNINPRKIILKQNILSNIKKTRMKSFTLLLGVRIHFGLRCQILKQKNKSGLFPLA